MSSEAKTGWLVGMMIETTRSYNDTQTTKQRPTSCETKVHISISSRVCPTGPSNFRLWPPVIQCNWSGSGACSSPKGQSPSTQHSIHKHLRKGKPQTGSRGWHRFLQQPGQRAYTGRLLLKLFRDASKDKNHTVGDFPSRRPPISGFDRHQMASSSTPLQTAAAGLNSSLDAITNEGDRVC